MLTHKFLEDVFRVVQRFSDLLDERVHNGVQLGFGGHARAGLVAPVVDGDVDEPEAELFRVDQQPSHL